jgi:hypothetical protein
MTALRDEPEGAAGPASGSTAGSREMLIGFLLVGCTWGVYFIFLWWGMLREGPEGLWAGSRTVWGDYAAHFAYAGVFSERSFGDWFSVHPLFAGLRFDYPFLADAISGWLMRAGVSRVPAFIVPSLIQNLALVALVHLFYARTLERPRHALLATTLFFCNGGLGFLLYAGDFFAAPSLATLALPPREYTWLPEYGIEWINIVTSELLPQRAFLLGMPIALFVLVTLLRPRPGGLSQLPLSRLIGLGAVASVLVVTHLHSLLALALICAGLCLRDLRSLRAWMTFAVATAIPSLSLLVLLYADVGSRGFVSWYPGWLAYHDNAGRGSLLRFLWLNWGIFLPVAISAIARQRAYRDSLVVAGIVIFVACFLFRFQPNIWDNTKLLTWAHLLLCIPVTRYLIELARRRRPEMKGLAVVLFVFLTASGGLDLVRALRSEQVGVAMWTREEMAFAEAFRAISQPNERVLCGDDHHHPIPALAGRPIVMGYRGWIATYGVRYDDVLRDLETMLQGRAGTEALLREYDIAWVVIGPWERLDFGARPEYFRTRHERVMERDGYEVFRVRDRVHDGPERGAR